MDSDRKFLATELDPLSPFSYKEKGELKGDEFFLTLFSNRRMCFKHDNIPDLFLLKSILDGHDETSSVKPESYGKTIDCF